MLKMLLSVVTSRLFWSGVVVAALCLLVLFTGPLLAFGEMRPLTDIVSRRLTVGILITGWLLSSLAPRIYHHRRQQALYRRLSRSETPSPAGRPEDQSLAKSFKRTVRLLKHHHFSGGTFLRRWSQRLGRQYMYQLPWYLVLGMEGSGKDKALQYAGLDFHHSLHQINCLSPADNSANHCEWYLTSQGVLVSPSSDYLAQGNGSWRLMLGLLTRYRARQPINGVVLAVSVQDLLHLSPDELYRQAVLLRKRLLELRRRFNIRFPLYLMITKADRLAGFSQYFSRYDGPELEQYWGMAFQWPCDRGQYSGFQTDFGEGYDGLQYRLHAALADTLAAEGDPRLRAKILAFPQAFAALRPLLLRYVSTLCAGSDCDGDIALRGLFFTSANQKNHSCKLSASPGQSTVFDYGYAVDETFEDSVKNSVPSRQSYFLKALFRDVILAEGGLAGLNFWSACRRRFQVIAGCGLLLALLGAVVTEFTTSYHNNRLYLAQVEGRIHSLAQQSARLNDLATTGLANLLPFLDDVRQLTRHEQFDLSHPPLNYRMGMYSGTLFGNAGEIVYLHALKRLLLPLVAQHITQMLYQANATDAEFVYQALAAYQMLYEPQHYDGEFLLAWLIATLPSMPEVITLGEERRAHLVRHLSRLVNGPPLRSPYARDSQLVREKQNAVQQISLPQRVYSRLKKNLLNDSRFAAVNLADLAAEGEGVLVRKSGPADRASVPGFFTPRGYWLGLNPLIADEVEALRVRDSWVLNQLAEQGSKTFASRVRYLYMTDFIQHWDDFLADIDLKQTTTLPQRINQVLVMSGDRSPLRELLINLDRIVSLPAPQTDEPLKNLEGDFRAEAMCMFHRLFTDKPEEQSDQTPERMVRNHYRDIIDLARPQPANGNRTVFDDIVRQLGGLYHYLAALRDQELPIAPAEMPTQLQANAMRLPTPFRHLLLSLAKEAHRDTHRETVQRLHRLFAGQIGGYYHFSLADRFPLAPNCRKEASHGDIAYMFAPGTGLADRFYQRYLADKVNTRDENWRFFPWVREEDARDDTLLLTFFRDAAYIRDAFFRQGDAAPAFSFTLRPLEMDNRILSLALDIDGQSFEYNHGPSTPYHMNWPGPEQTGSARLTMTSSDGQVKTLVMKGPWAFHRLLDAGHVRWEDNHPVGRVTFIIEEQKATLEIAADSMRNPFILPNVGSIFQQETL